MHLLIVALNVGHHQPNCTPLPWTAHNGIPKNLKTVSGTAHINGKTNKLDICSTRAYGITNENKGQVVKEFDVTLGIDPSLLEGRTPQHKVRPSKKKLPGKDISILTNPPIRTIELY